MYLAVDPQDISSLASQEQHISNYNKLINFQQKKKFNIIKNNFKLLTILNILPIIGIFFCIYENKWCLLAQLNDRNIWAGLVRVHEFLQDGNEQTYSYQEFQKNYCSTTQQDQQVQFACNIVLGFIVGGGVCFILFLIALLLQIMNLILIYLIMNDKDVCSKYLEPKNVQIILLITILNAMIFWTLSTGIFVLKAQNIGMSFYWAWIWVGFYIMLVLYYKRIESYQRQQEIIRNLLEN